MVHKASSVPDYSSILLDEDIEIMVTIRILCFHMAKLVQEYVYDGLANG